MIIVDSSVLVAFFRGHSHPAVERLASLEATGAPFSLPELSYQEILQGARDDDLERIAQVRPLRTARS